jgi:hypothetical protein
MNVVMSTNSELHRHSRPYSNQSITDSGVAVYFTRKGRKQAIVCDKWDSIRDNLQAVAKTIEACAGLNVGGQGDGQPFQGFTAIPASATCNHPAPVDAASERSGATQHQHPNHL